MPLNYRWSLEISSRESERGLSHMSVYFLLIQCRSLAIVCSPEVTSSSFGGGVDLTPEVDLKTPVQV